MIKTILWEWSIKKAAFRSPNVNNDNNAYYVNPDGNINNNNNVNWDSCGRRPALILEPESSNIYFRYESRVHLIKGDHFQSAI